jgi:hypothetical protein
VPSSEAAETVHCLRIDIERIDPPVWRRVVVPSTMTLARLHKVIQEVFGWWDYHLHEFEIDGRRYGIDDGEDWDPPLDERRTKLRDVAPQRKPFAYLYDFGDNWRHRINVEEVEPLDDGLTYPRCVGGQRARPPEDVGGVGGYAEFLAVIADPRHEEHDHLLAWAGGSFDPEACDLVDINARLTPARRSRR